MVRSWSQGEALDKLLREAKEGLEPPEIPDEILGTALAQIAMLIYLRMGKEKLSRIFDQILDEFDAEDPSTTAH